MSTSVPRSCTDAKASPVTAAIVVDATPAPIVLFDEDGARVTPSWLVVDDTSHAMRTIVKLRLVSINPPRNSWTALFYFSLPLIVLSGFGLEREYLPLFLAWALFVGSVLLCLTAARHAFVVPDRARLEVGFSDGSMLRVDRGRAGLQRMHAALIHALDWHQGASTPLR